MGKTIPTICANVWLPQLYAGHNRVKVAELYKWL